MAQSYVMSFLEQAQHCSNLGELEQAWVKTLNHIGFSFGAFVNAGTGGMASSDAIVSSNFPKAWLDHYLGDNLFSIDPFVTRLSEYSKPILWTDLRGMSERFSEREQYFMNLTPDYGLNKGMALPLVTTAGHEAFMTVTTYDHGYEVDKLAVHYQEQLMTVGYMYQTLAKTMVSQGDSSADARKRLLSPREKECILWSAKGKSAWEVGGILNLSERTVIFHLNNAKKKLRATSKAHLVTKAVSGGFVDI